MCTILRRESLVNEGGSWRPPQTGSRFLLAVQGSISGKINQERDCRMISVYHGNFRIFSSPIRKSDYVHKDPDFPHCWEKIATFLGMPLPLLCKSGSRNSTFSVFSYLLLHSRFSPLRRLVSFAVMLHSPFQSFRAFVIHSFRKTVLLNNDAKRRIRVASKLMSP